MKKINILFFIISLSGCSNITNVYDKTFKDEIITCPKILSPNSTSELIINSENNDIEGETSYYLKRQESMATLPQSIKKFNWEASKVKGENYFYDAVNYMSSNSFDSLLNDYAVTLNTVLKDDTDLELYGNSQHHRQKCRSLLVLLHVHLCHE